MADTLEEGSLLVANRLAYLNDSPERGDIVIFSHPEINERHVVKRVIAVPGDVIEIREGRVYLNGDDTPVDEPYVKEFSNDSMDALSVPDGCYFIMGDNRQSSHDSRYLSYRFVREDDICAKAVMTLLPKVKKLK